MAARHVGFLAELFVEVVEEEVGVDAAGAVRRAGHQVGGDGPGQQLEEDDQGEGAGVDAGAQPQRDADQDQQAAEGLRLGGGVAAGEDLGELDHADGAEQADGGAEEDEEGADGVRGLGPGGGVHALRSSSTVASRPWAAAGRSRTAMNRAMATDPVKPRKASTSMIGK